MSSQSKPGARDLALPLEVLIKKSATENARKRPRESTGTPDGSIAASNQSSKSARGSRGNAPRGTGRRGREDEGSRGTVVGRGAARGRPWDELTDLEVDLARLLTPMVRHHNTGRRVTMCWEFLSVRGCAKKDGCGYAHPTKVDYTQLNELLLMVLTCFGGYPRGGRFLNKTVIRERLKEFRQITEPCMDELLEKAVREKGGPEHVSTRIRERYLSLHGEMNEAKGWEEGDTDMQIQIVNDIALLGGQGNQAREEEQEEEEEPFEDVERSCGDASGAEQELEGDEEEGLDPSQQAQSSPDDYGVPHATGQQRRGEEAMGKAPSWLPPRARTPVPQAQRPSAATSGQTLSSVPQQATDKAPRSPSASGHRERRSRSPSPRPEVRGRSRSQSRGGTRSRSRPYQAAASGDLDHRHRGTSEVKRGRDVGHGSSDKTQGRGSGYARSRSRSRSRSRERRRPRDWDGKESGERQGGYGNGRGEGPHWRESASMSRRDWRDTTGPPPKTQIPTGSSQSHGRRTERAVSSSGREVGGYQGEAVSHHGNNGHVSDRHHSHSQADQEPPRDGQEQSREGLTRRGGVQAGHTDEPGIYAALRAKEETIHKLQQELEKERVSREAAVNGVQTAVKATMDLLNRAVQEKSNEAQGLKRQVAELESQLQDERQVAVQWRKAAEGAEQSKTRDRARIRDLEDLLERAERKLKDFRRR